ncbi:3628_t:CDS:2 [Scutellospora calospora]|uniref:3628_t:CDS:1 n=1 Tax=Scutellospora calospora TaxID=85575 RepID=A0ACA9K8L7_9GLOM|nr:3628_t:CDS:2 [Scutellospora calospora]
MQSLSPCSVVITGQLGFGGCGSPRQKSSFNNSSPTTTTSHQKSSRIVQSFLSSVLQLASSTNSTVEFTKREFTKSQVDKSNPKSLLSEMLKKHIENKEINRGKPIIIKKQTDLTIATDTNNDFGISNDAITTNNEINNTKKVLKFGNCPLVVREKSSTQVNDESSKKPDVFTDESLKVTSTTVIRRFSPLPVTSQLEEEEDDDESECDICDEYEEDSDKVEYDENYIENYFKESLTQNNVTSTYTNTLTTELADGKPITPTIASTTSPTSCHSTTSYYSTAISIFTPTNNASTYNYKSKSLPFPPRSGILVNRQPGNLRKKGIPIPLSNTNNHHFDLGSKSHHYGSRDKFHHKRKLCRRHSHNSGEKNINLDLERMKDDDILFWPIST